MYELAREPFFRLTANLESSQHLFPPFWSVAQMHDRLVVLVEQRHAGVQVTKGNRGHPQFLWKDFECPVFFTPFFFFLVFSCQPLVQPAFSGARAFRPTRPDASAHPQRMPPCQNYVPPLAFRGSDGPRRQ